jgi:hypothetical protein
MTERAPPLDLSNPRARRRAPQGGRASETEIRDVVDRAARVADGLALLEGAPLECAAVLLGVSPPAIERVRAAFEDALARDAARMLFARASARPPTAADDDGARPAPPRDGEQLLAAATRRPGGLALLLAASPECAAVAFAVHPDLVHAARELARCRGLSHDLPPDA